MASEKNKPNGAHMNTENIKDSIKNILECAVQAPSGNNSQPWRFVVRGNKIYIFNVLDKDITPYNFDQKGSYLAHGALIENISIIASQYGYSTNIEPFPNTDILGVVAIITLEKGPSKEEPLFTHIPHRATNRRLYKKIPLQLEHKTSILKIEKEVIGGGEIKLIDNRNEMLELSNALALHERLIFENRMIHTIVFSSILWSEKENAEKRRGLYIKTKFPDMPSVLLPLMKLFGRWSFVRILNKVGFAKKIQQKSAEACLSSSALCAILVDSDTNKDFLMGGRLFQRIWLTATQLGLSIQPMTGIPYLARRILLPSEDREADTAVYASEQATGTKHSLLPSEDREADTAVYASEQ
ncbi:MAG: nitroreductase family protein, partial [Patescibacteria group bacterium]